MSGHISADTRVRRRGALIGAAAAIGLALGACSTSSAPKPTTAPVVVNPEITVHRLDYDTRGTPDPAQNWGDFYLPAGPQAPDTIPLVVLIHGGAWKTGFDADTMTAYARDLAKRGMAVYNIEYRRIGSGGGWPTTFDDVADALDYVVEINRRFPQITTDDELVVGHSAGAQLAAWAGTRDSSDDKAIASRPQFRPTRVVAMAGPLDMVYAANHGDDRIVTALGGTPQEVPDRYRSVDPMQNINTAMPIIAVHGDRDTVVPITVSRRYIDEVSRRNGIGDLVVATGENHLSLISPTSAAYPRILDIITDASSATIDELKASYDGG